MYYKTCIKLLLVILVGVPILLHLTVWSTAKTMRTSADIHKHSNTKASLKPSNAHVDQTLQPSNPAVNSLHSGNFSSSSSQQPWAAECAAPTANANVIGKNLKTEEFKCVRLEVLRPPVQICVHNTKDDKFVSGTIAAGNFWERRIVKQFQRVLTAHPDLHVIDVGANIGQYSLVAAHMGRQVVAVEARLLHAHMIQRAVQLNGFQDRVTLVHNALSDSYGSVTLGTYKGNQGGTHILTRSNNSNETETVAEADVRHNLTSFAILMNDLAPVVNFSKALMKIDIEGFEHRAFHCGQKLFDQVHIPFIFMEWGAMRKRAEELILPMLTWLERRDYEPLQVNFKALEFSNWKKWPLDVVFKHKSLSLPTN